MPASSSNIEWLLIILSFTLNGSDSSSSCPFSNTYPYPMPQLYRFCLFHAYPKFSPAPTLLTGSGSGILTIDLMYSLLLASSYFYCFNFYYSAYFDAEIYSVAFTASFMGEEVPLGKLIYCGFNMVFIYTFCYLFSMGYDYIFG